MLRRLARRFADSQLRRELEAAERAVTEAQRDVARLRHFYRLAIAQRDRALARSSERSGPRI